MNYLYITIVTNLSITPPKNEKDYKKIQKVVKNWYKKEKNAIKKDNREKEESNEN